MRVNERHKEFIGTTQYHKFSPLFQNVLLTDGAIFIAQEYGAFWLMDAIASHLPSVNDHFGVVLLEHSPTENKENQFILSIQDDIPMNKQYATQKIEYSDFPTEGIQFYIQNDGNQWVIYLPSEH